LLWYKVGVLYTQITVFLIVALAGDLAKTEEDVLTFAMFPELGREFLQQREEGALEAEVLLPPDQGNNDSAQADLATEFKIDVHGEVYDVAIPGVGDFGGNKRKLYLSLDGMPEEVVFESLNDYVSQGSSGRSMATEPSHVSAAMPGNIIDALVAPGDTVSAGQAVLVTEAMKMESEVNANIAGVIKAVHVTKGDRVTPGETLIEIE